MSERLKITANKQNLFFISPTSEGFCYGFCLGKDADIHLTFFYSGDELKCHVTDKRNDQTQWIDFPPQSVEELSEIFRKHHGEWLTTYHGNRKCWIAVGDLKRKIKKYLEMPEKEGKLPYEFIEGKVELDFQNEKRWKKVRIRDILDSWEVSFIEDNGEIKYIQPIDENNMLCWTEEEYSDFLDNFVEFLGMDYLVNYISDHIGEEKLGTLVEEKIKQK